MIQEILVYIIIMAVALKVAYSLYKSATMKDKAVCGGCAGCSGVKVKGELKKKEKPVLLERKEQISFFRSGAFRYTPQSK